MSRAAWVQWEAVPCVEGSRGGGVGNHTMQMNQMGPMNHQRGNLESRLRGLRSSRSDFYPEQAVNSNDTRSKPQSCLNDSLQGSPGMSSGPRGPVQRAVATEGTPPAGPGGAGRCFTRIKQENVTGSPDIYPANMERDSADRMDFGGSFHHLGATKQTSLARDQGPRCGAGTGRYYRSMLQQQLMDTGGSGAMGTGTGPLGQQGQPNQSPSWQDAVMGNRRQFANTLDDLLVPPTTSEGQSDEQTLLDQLDSLLTNTGGVALEEIDRALGIPDRASQTQGAEQRLVPFPGQDPSVVLDQKPQRGQGYPGPPAVATHSAYGGNPMQGWPQQGGFGPMLSQMGQSSSSPGVGGQPDFLSAQMMAQLSREMVTMQMRRWRTMMMMMQQQQQAAAEGFSPPPNVTTPRGVDNPTGGPSTGPPGQQFGYGGNYGTGQQGDPSSGPSGGNPPNAMMPGRLGPQSPMMQQHPQGGPMYQGADMKGWSQGGMGRNSSYPQQQFGLQGNPGPYGAMMMNEGMPASAGGHMGQMEGQMGMNPVVLGRMLMGPDQKYC